MKLLLDQNLSDRLLHLLEREYPGSAHVRHLGFARADDEVIWEFARREGFTIVSKDGDFHQRSLLYGHPPKVVWVTLGNCSTNQIAELLRFHRRTVEAFVAARDESFLALG